MSIFLPFLALGRPDTLHDSFLPNVVALGHLDNNLTNSVSRGNTPFTLSGTAALSSTQSQFGGFSVHIPTGVSNYVQLGSHADYGLGTGDHTIEFWIRMSDVTTAQNICDFRLGAANQPRPTIYVTGGTVRYFSSNADRITSGAAAIVVNTWTAISLCRISAVSRLFVQGVQVGSNFADTENCPTTSPVMGGSNISTNSVDSYVDEFRITKGSGRYAANYTPATAAFPIV